MTLLQQIAPFENVLFQSGARQILKLTNF